MSDSERWWMGSCPVCRMSWAIKGSITDKLRCASCETQLLFTRIATPPSHLHRYRQEVSWCWDNPCELAGK